MATSEADIAAQLIERLLGDPAFRAEFRRDPASACRNAGLDELADEMSIGAGKAMMTLDQRESKSSLAGVMMAAAMEGVGVYQFGEHVLPHLDDVPSAVGDVLSRVSLPAVPGRGALSGSPDAPDVAPAAGGGAAGAAEAGAPGGGGGGAAAAPPAGAPPDTAAANGKAAAAPAEAAAKPEPALPPEHAAAHEAAGKIAAAESPEAKNAAAAEDAVAKIKEDAKDLPEANDMPDSGVAPQPVEEVGKSGAAAAPKADVPAVGAPAAVVEPQGQGAAPVDQAHGGSQKVDPTQFGGEGSGGTPSAEALALLKNKNISFDDTGVSDLKAGKIDPRVVAVLTKLSHEHKLTISCMCSDHSKFTSGGSVSNHFHGRGVDIASVDGETVNPGSVAARELATEMQEISRDYRPDEIGSPWAISGPGYFTDAGHQDHVHLGFKTEIDPNWKPPADVAASGATPAAAAPAGAPAAVPAVAGAPAAAAAAVPGQPATPGEVIGAPKPKASDSISFKAVTAKDAADAAPKKTDSLQFMAVQPPAGPANFVATPGPC